MNSKEYFTVKELSGYFGIKPKTLYSWVSKGVLPHYRIEGLIRFRRREIDQKMQSCRRKEFNLANLKTNEIEDEFSL